MVDELSRRYAELAVRVGVNLQAGQTLFVMGQPEHASLMRTVAEAGWKAGAGDVQLVYRDDHERRLHALHAADELLDRTAAWLETAVLAMEGAGLVFVLGDADPDLFHDVDQARAARAEPRRVREIVHDQTSRHAVAWTIIVGPTADWARDVLGRPDPDLLWQELAAVAGLDEPDPLAAWRERLAALDARGAALDRAAFDRLHFSGPGTDLTVGLLPGARWCGSGASTYWGQTYVANLPTEEVFTTPDRLRTEGTVATTKPLY
jgi:aminopeptidase